MSTEDNAGVLAPPPLFFLIPLVAGLLLSWMLPLDAGPLFLRVSLGAILLGGYVGLTGWAILTLKRGGTDFLPQKGSAAIVTGGPFRFTRNPMYLAMAFAHAGIALLANSLWALLVLPVSIALAQHGAILREEKYLERKFGAAYVAYKRRVRRWI